MSIMLGDQWQLYQDRSDYRDIEPNGDFHISLNQADSLNEWQNLTVNYPLSQGSYLSKSKLTFDARNKFLRALSRQDHVHSGPISGLTSLMKEANLEPILPEDYQHTEVIRKLLYSSLDSYHAYKDGDPLHFAAESIVSLLDGAKNSLRGTLSKEKSQIAISNLETALKRNIAGLSDD